MLELCLDRMLPQCLERCLLPRELHGRRPLRGRRGQFLKHAVAENVESGIQNLTSHCDLGPSRCFGVVNTTARSLSHFHAIHCRVHLSVPLSVFRW